MRTIIKEQIWKILEVFYLNKNTPVHLREISRKIKLKESATTRHLEYLLKEKILDFQREANLKKFYVKKKEIPSIFPMYDLERYRNLNPLRRRAIEYYLDKLKNKPVLIIIFGSTAKGTEKQESDLDIIEVFNNKEKNSEARKYSESQTGIHLNTFQLTWKGFKEELKMKKDHVIQAGINTGFPAYNQKFFYEALNERV